MVTEEFQREDQHCLLLASLLTRMTFFLLSSSLLGLPLLSHLFCQSQRTCCPREALRVSPSSLSF